MTSTRLQPALCLALMTLLAAAFAVPAEAGRKSRKNAKAASAAKKRAPAAPATADEVLARHLEAVGGVAAVTAPKRNRVITGTFSVPMQQLSGKMKMYFERPNRMLMVMESSAIGKIEAGFDGTTAWSRDPFTGARVIDGSELETERIKADFDADAHLEDLYVKRELVGVSDFEGRSCYEVLLVDGAESETRAFFDVESGRQAGSDMKVSTPMGEFPTRTVLTDYRAFNGHWIPARTVVRTNAMGMSIEQIVTIDTVEIDVAEFPSMTPPAEVLELAAAATGE